MVLEKVKIYENQYYSGFYRSGVSNIPNYLQIPQSTLLRSLKEQMWAHFPVSAQTPACFSPSCPRWGSPSQTPLTLLHARRTHEPSCSFLRTSEDRTDGPPQSSPSSHLSREKVSFLNCRVNAVCGQNSWQKTVSDSHSSLGKLIHCHPCCKANIY